MARREKRHPSAALMRKPCVRCGLVARNRWGSCRPCLLEAMRNSKPTAARLRKPCVTCGQIDRYVSNGDCRPCAIKRSEVWISARRAKPGWPEFQRNKTHRARLTKFSLTEDEFEAIGDRQQWRCAICTKSARLAIDHDHTTGIIRGLLCGPCNRALGLFQDCADTMRSAILYLRTTGNKSCAARGAELPEVGGETSVTTKNQKKSDKKKQAVSAKRPRVSAKEIKSAGKKAAASVRACSQCHRPGHNKRTCPG